MTAQAWLLEYHPDFEGDQQNLGDLPTRETKRHVWDELFSFLPDLPPRQRDIAHLIYNCGMRQTAVGQLLGVTQGGISYRLIVLTRQVAYLKKRGPVCFHCWLEKYQSQFSFREIAAFFIFVQTCCYQDVALFLHLCRNDGWHFINRRANRIHNCPDIARAIALAKENLLILSEMYHEQKSFHHDQIRTQMEKPVHRTWHYITAATRASKQAQQKRLPIEKVRQYQKTYKERHPDTVAAGKKARQKRYIARRRQTEKFKANRRAQYHKRKLKRFVFFEVWNS